MVKEYHPNYIHQRAYFTDLDRCLITERLYDVYDEADAESGLVDTNLVREARKEIEASGGSFDKISWLQDHADLSDRDIAHLMECYITKVHSYEVDAFLASGAHSLLDALEGSPFPHFIMTKGNRLLQMTKIKSIGLSDIPTIVVDHTDKSQDIRDWWNAQAQYFEIKFADTALKAYEIILTDDKKGAFKSLPPAPQARGYWIETAPLLISQLGDLPSNVRTVSSLGDFLGYENLNTTS